MPGSTYYNHVDIDRVNNRLYLAGNIFTVDGGDLSFPFVATTKLDGSDYKVILSQNADPDLGTAVYSLATSGEDNLLFRHQHYGPGGPINNTGIYRSDLNGNGFTRMQGNGATLQVFYAHDMEVDPLANKLYYTNSVDFNGLRRMNFDGTNIETIYNSLPNAPGLNIALDVANNRLFLSQSGDDPGDQTVIKQMTLDGQNQTVILAEGILDEGVRFDDIQIEDIEYDGGSMLYWIGDTGLYRAKTDGTNAQKLIPFTTSYANSLAITTVPEVSSLWLLALPLTALGFQLVRRAKRATAN